MNILFLHTLEVAIWLVRSTTDRTALAKDIVLCSWTRHFTLILPISTQVYKWVTANLMLGGNPYGLASIPGGVGILLVTSRY